jgi:pimeloyl-ACP methyl ester carboxylesterase
MDTCRVGLITLWLIGLLLTAVAGPARGDDGTSAPSPEPPKANPATKTLGGTQFWSDELVFRGWRIQQNVFSEHYRLLDESDRRHASGTFDECQAKLEEIKKEKSLPPLKGPAVVTLHGLIRSRDMMAGIGEYLEREGDYTWLNVSYASTRRTLDEHAASLARVIDHLDGVTQIDFVCHSLGNLVVRRYLGEASAEQPKWKVDPRVRRMVMLAPPNHGAHFAEYFKDNKLFDLVLGPSGKQLAGQWSEVEKRLAVPPFEFGIIAGSKKNGRVENPLVTGEGDLVVSVEETRLAGACDFLVVPLAHGELMDDPDVRRCVRRFLEDGCFVAADKRMPIAKEEKPAGEDAKAAP